MPDGYVYILAGGGFHKIGKTINPEDRIRWFETKLPFPVKLTHLIPCQNYGLAEKALHRKFAPRREHGEWFKLSESDLETIKQIKAMKGQYIEY